MPLFISSQFGSHQTTQFAFLYNLVKISKDGSLISYEDDQWVNGHPRKAKSQDVLRWYNA